MEKDICLESSRARPGHGEDLAPPSAATAKWHAASRKRVRRTRFTEQVVE